MIGDAIKLARSLKGWSQQDLASELEVAQTTVSSWERNRNTPNEETLLLIEGALGPLEISEDDEVEGIEHERSQGFGEYPLDSLMIRTETRTIQDVMRRLEQKRIVLDPDFQRAFVWDRKRQSRLIESALMRIPLPVMYLAEDKDGRLVVVDGRQRLTTFRDFASGKLRLQLDGSELNRKHFADLEVRYQTRFEDTNLILYIIDSKVDDRVRLDIFERVNGGVALTRQQMRNCLYNGPATKWLADQAAFQPFASMFSGTTRASMLRTMRDREIVNRFSAFRLLGWRTYRGDMDNHLGAALGRMSKMSAVDLDALAIEFKNAIVSNILVFGSNAFRKHKVDQAGRPSQFNVALWDVLSTTLSRYDTSKVELAAPDIRQKFYALMDDEAFDRMISFGTNQQDRVWGRFNRVEEAVKEVLGDP